MNISELKRLLQVIDYGSIYTAGNPSGYDTLILLGYVDVVGNKVTATEKAGRLIQELNKFLELHH